MPKVTDPYVPWGMRAGTRKLVIFQWYRGEYRARFAKKVEAERSEAQQELFDKWRSGLRDWKDLSDHAKMQWFNYHTYGGYW